MASFIILTLLSVMTVTEVSSVYEATCSYEHLLEHLGLLNTNQVLANVRPVSNWTSPTQVKIDLRLYGILDVDAKSQTITCQVWSILGWVNEFISWNESDFCGIDRLAVPRQKIWIPDVAIQEDISSTDSVLKAPYVSVDSSGVVHVMGSLRLTTACNMNLYKFPFDTQTCIMTVISISHTDAGIVIDLWSTNEILNQFSHVMLDSRGEWSLQNISTTKTKVFYSNNTWDRLIFKITIKRSPLLYVMNFLIPLLYFLVLDLASFFIDQSRGEKLSFKITILLSISVLLLMFNDILPSNADKLPLIALNCTVVFTLVCLNLLVSILLDFLSNLGLDRKEGCHLQTHASHVQSSAPENRAEKEVPAEASPEQKTPGRGTEGLSDPRLLQLALEEVWRIRQDVTSAGAGENRKSEYWQEVVRRLDMAYFCIYIAVIILFHGYLFFLWIQPM